MIAPCCCAGEFSWETFIFLHRKLFWVKAEERDHFLGVKHMPAAAQFYFIIMEHINNLI